MNFQPELADKVVRREKTVTRRLASDNPRSPWSVEGCKLQVGRDYAVCPGRGKHAIGRLRVTDVHLTNLGYLSDEEARREGFSNWERCYEAFVAINGRYDAAALVWRIEFECVEPILNPLGEPDIDGSYQRYLDSLSPCPGCGLVDEMDNIEGRSLCAACSLDERDDAEWDDFRAEDEELVS